ncbi:MAG: hypothetical protein ACI9OJ_006006, partial [Myxococcota bacterium]
MTQCQIELPVPTDREVRREDTVVHVAAALQYYRDRYGLETASSAEQKLFPMGHHEVQSWVWANDAHQLKLSFRWQTHIGLDGRTQAPDKLHLTIHYAASPLLGSRQFRRVLGPDVPTATTAVVDLQQHCRGLYLVGPKRQRWANVGPTFDIVIGDVEATCEPMAFGDFCGANCELSRAYESGRHTALIQALAKALGRPESGPKDGVSTAVSTGWETTTARGTVLTASLRLGKSRLTLAAYRP